MMEKRIEQVKGIARAASEMTGREISTYQVRWWLRRTHDRLPAQRLFSRLSVTPSDLRAWLDAHTFEHNPVAYVPRVTKTAKRLGTPVSADTAARLQVLVRRHGERASARLLGPSVKTIRAAINGESVLRVTAIAIAIGLQRAEGAERVAAGPAHRLPHQRRQRGA
jgi:hypothetical protein